VKQPARFLSLLTYCWLPLLVQADTQPAAWQGLPMASYVKLDDKSFSRSDLQLSVSLNAKETLLFNVSSSAKHDNGDISVQGKSAHGRGSITATFGDDRVFGQIHQDGKDYVLTTDRSGQWVIELPSGGISYNSCDTENTAGNKMPPTTQSVATNTAVTHSTLDILLTYNQEFSDRYPGDLLETRLNHFVQVANQSLGNSHISLGLRVVGIEFFNYRNDNSNRDLLVDMLDTLRGQNIVGLEGLQALRDERGADLVIMFRPHDIETRGSCGIAFFPDNDPNLGVNVVSDAMSSWSVCLDDVLIHEIGHNLGAGHQAGNGGGSFAPLSAGFFRPDQFSTIMASFGTGKADRFRGLPMFSNPDLMCGGYPCGSNGIGQQANNASVIRDVMADVIAYRTAVSNAPIPVQPGRADDDIDGDSVIDWLDHFPFDPTEQADADLDGSGDLTDVFPDDGAESLDTDQDLIGDNADNDDDNDQVADEDDQFPKDPQESTDNDDDGTGDNADAFPQDADEFADTDLDGTGNNADDDDDGDGFPELDPVAEDILVISVGNNRVLRYDASSGVNRGIEVLPDDGLLTFQSDLAYRKSDHTLLYTSASAVKRINLLNRQALGVYVPPYADNGGVQLGTGFPSGITSMGEGQRIATSLTSNAVISLFTGQQQASKDNSLSWAVSEGESPIDIVASDDMAIILGQATGTLYKADALGSTFLGPVGAEWMQDPHRMAIAGDGRLLISDQGRNSVVAIDLQNGEFLGDFVRLAEQGYSNPTGLAVTGSGQLLVASADDNVILKYDLETGDFIGELVKSGQGGLDQPFAITIVPQLLDRFGTDPDRVIRPNPGVWFNPASNGRGFDIEVFNNRLSAIWFTYDDQGQPLWYIGAGDLNGFEFEADLLLTRLTAEGVFEFDSVGTLTLNFLSERTADVNWTIGEQAGGESLQWLEWSTEPANRDFTGQWGRADGPGWGVSIATEGERTVAIAFIYDSAGNPRWAISDPVDGLPPFDMKMNVAFSDTLCPACTVAPVFEFQAAGNMTLMIDDNGTWTSSIVLPAPLSGQWLENQTAIIRFSEEPLRPR
jgi:hypothetical protein